MTTCGFRHPWFDMPSAKRKLPSSPSSSDEDDYDRVRAYTYSGGSERQQSPYRTAPAPSYTGSGVATSAARPAKRRRCSALERGFAHLTINHPINTNVRQGTHTSPYPSPATSYPSSNPSIVELDMPLARTPSPVPMDSDDLYSVLRPTSIEEPTSPIPEDASVPLSSDDKSGDGINDIKMKSRSWYEPEKDRKCLCFLRIFKCL